MNNVALYNTCLYFIQTENSEFVHRLHMQSRQHFLLFGSRLLARVLKEGVQFWYNNTSSTVKGGGEGFEKTFLWKTFEVHVSSCQYLFQARSKFFKHTRLCEFVPLCFNLFLTTTFSFSQVHRHCQIDQNVKCCIMLHYSQRYELFIYLVNILASHSPRICCGHL